MSFIRRSSLLLLLALPLAADRIVLVDESMALSASKPEQVRFSVRQRPIIIEARFQCQDPKEKLRALVLTGWGADRLLAGKGYDALAATELVSSGEVRMALSDAGEYAVIFLGQSAGAKVTVTEVFPTMNAKARSAPASTIAVVCALSALFLIGLYATAGRRLLKAWRERIHPQ